MAKGPTRHAYIDESRRGRDYFLTASLLSSQHIQVIARAVRAAMSQGRSRSHFSDESESDRKKLLASYCALDTQVLVAVARCGTGDDQIARNACLEALVGVFQRHRVGVTVLDTRGEPRDRLDRRVVAQAVQQGLAPADLQYNHRGSRDEILIGLPDAFGWAYGAGGEWRRAVMPLVIDELKA